MATGNNRGGNTSAKTGGAGKARPSTLPSPVVVNTGTSRMETLDRKEAAVVYAAKGYTPSRICKMMPGLALSTLNDWRSSDWWIPSVHGAAQEIAQSPQEAFVPRLSKALEVVDDTMDTAEGEGTRLKAAEMVMDRVWGKPLIRQVSDARIAVNIQFVDVPDAIDVDSGNIDGDRS